jgi:hypothetical protein
VTGSWAVTHKLKRNKLTIRTRHLILDESDRLLSSDFIPQIQPIVESCTHPLVQKCFLSATMPAGPEAMASKWMKGGVRIVVGLKYVSFSPLYRPLPLPTDLLALDRRSTSHLAFGFPPTLLAPLED